MSVWLKEATRRSWGTSGGSFTARVSKGLLHSTETGGWPGYGAGKSAPHFTIDPRKRQTQQHIPLDVAARALRNEAGGVQTNRDGVIQFEIVGTCNTAYRDRYGYLYLPEMSDDELAYVAGILKAASVATGFPLRSSVTWKSYKAGAASGSYGKNNGVRLSGKAWQDYAGVLGHMHAAENDHGDPGDINIDRILELAGGSITLPTPVRPVQPVYGTWSRAAAGARVVGLYDVGDDVKTIQAKVGVKQDGYFGPDTEDAVEAFQGRNGLTVDGIVGPQTWGKILTKPAPANAPAKTYLPAFPLSEGHWFGPESSNKRNHSGYWVADRAHIRALLAGLRARGWANVPSTDRYTAAVEKVVRAYQDDAGLTRDGLVGVKTWNSIRLSRVR